MLPLSRSPRRLVAFAVAALLVLPLPVALSDTAPPEPRVIVAAIDTGMNPYHEFFHHGGEGPYLEDAPSAVTPDVLAELGIGEDQVIDVTRTGDIAADLAADEEQWAAVERGVPYWYKGTNVIGISFASNNRLRPEPPKSAHGVGVTASVLNANPEAIVVLVEGWGSTGEEWAFTHPAVDIITTSYGPRGSPPLPGPLNRSYSGVVQRGKLHFGAVDNSPALSPVDTTGGPWWSIGVAGYQEGEGEGRQPLSGSLPDFVGDFTQRLPYCFGCDFGESTVNGTSFATPRSAGTMSKVLLEARRAAGHTGGIVTDGVDRPAMVVGPDGALTNWDLRRALEQGAYTLTPEDHSGSAANPPASPVAAWTLIGWGAITPDPERGVIEQTLAHLGVEGEATRTKSADTCAGMTALMEARRQYWTYYGTLDDEGWLEDDFPYRSC